MNHLLTITEVAAILKISKSNLYKWIESGKISCYKINGNVRFNQEHLKNWIESKERKLKKTA